jgi:outer membrane protein assembly factor BamA
MASVLLQSILVVALSGLAPGAEARPLPQSGIVSDARIASVQVKGTRRYTPADVSRLSGLEIGKPTSATDLTAAANRLAATGLFDSVKYTYTTAGRQWSVTLEIEEAAWTMPVVLDNFIWMTDNDLIAAVRQEVPSFDGTAPSNVGAADFLIRAFQNVLQAKGISGRVEFETQADLKGSIPKYVFSVKDPSPKVCALHAAGASAISESDLLAPLASIVGHDYSRLFVITASNGTLVDMYRRRGHWRAAFDPPSAATGDCPGVAVTLNVKEGPAYAWDHAEWTGNAVLTPGALDALVAMKAGDVADATRIDAGLRQVTEAYGKQGYILEHARSEPKLDEAQRRATFQFQVNEGPQFRMGTLEFAGITESDAETLAKKWQLKPGDVFDASYMKRYQFEVISPLQTRSGARGSVRPDLDVERRVVSVKIVFK